MLRDAVRLRCRVLDPEEEIGQIRLAQLAGDTCHPSLQPCVVARALDKVLGNDDLAAIGV